MSLADDALQLLSFWHRTAKQDRVDPISQSVAGAAESLINKEAKLELAQRAIMTEDLRQLAAADRAGVRQLRSKHLGPQPPAEGQGDDLMGDLIIADDNCSIKSTTISWKAIVALALITTILLTAVAITTWFFAGQNVLTKSAGGTPPPLVKEWFEIDEVRNTDGTWKEIGRRRLRLTGEGRVEEVK